MTDRYALNIYKSIKKLIDNKKMLKSIQNKSLKNFYLTDKYISKKIDNYRELFFQKHLVSNDKNKKIIHVTNFNLRHNAKSNTI